MEARGVPDRLAARIAFQLVLKCSPSQLGDERVWSALGSLVRQDVERLQQGLRLTDRLIRVGLPKLSADDMERLFNEMHRVDARYGRTLAEAALDGADPREMARRYARAFTESVSRLVAKNPRIARTLAGVAFRSRHPLANALEYLSRFDALVHEFQGDVGFARTVARAAFIAPDPVSRRAPVRARLPRRRPTVDDARPRTHDCPHVGRHREFRRRAADDGVHARREVSRR